jgi:hypothetical protein
MSAFQLGLVDINSWKTGFSKKVVAEEVEERRKQSSNLFMLTL